jgi:hypothetical protein
VKPDDGYRDCSDAILLLITTLSCLEDQGPSETARGAGGAASDGCGPNRPELADLPS